MADVCGRTISWVHPRVVVLDSQNTTKKPKHVTAHLNAPTEDVFGHLISWVRIYIRKNIHLLYREQQKCRFLE